MRRLAIMDRDELVQVDATTGKTTGNPVVHPNLIYSVAYDRSGQRLLTGCADQFARIYAAGSEELLTTIRHSDIVQYAAWFPDGNARVTAHGKADLVRVWKLGESSEQGFNQELPGSVMHLKWSDDGQQFLPSGMDQVRHAGASQVLNTSDGKPVGLPVSFPGRVSDGCFVPNSRVLILAGSAAADETGDDAFKLYRQKKNEPGHIVFASRDTGEYLFPPIDTKTNVIAVESSPDGTVVAALCYDHELLIIDPKTGIVRVRCNALPGKNCFMGFVIYRRLAFSPAGDRFAVWGGQSRTVEMRSAIDGQLLFTVAHTNPSNVDWFHDVVFSSG
jgi:WD40 repeat protein